MTHLLDIFAVSSALVFAVLTLVPQFMRRLLGYGDERDGRFGRPLKSDPIDDGWRLM